ncbi:22417_t:CDS:2 [Gigaspora margarita]|uniref:22417_t:CDS:1 n=1 Tax=Gigaspora margarita TaxID=4874 RepID=A0ABN7UW07_GIGMA|nr:22417_t:CDS:2 [Gigaspora margarita]
MPTTSFSSPPTDVGCPIPPNTPHAISVALPTWQDAVDYEEGRERVVNRMLSGYPRFFISKKIQQLMSIYEQKFAKPSESCFLFPSRKTAECCRDYLRRYYESSNPTCLRLAEITIVTPDQSKSLIQGNITLHVVLFPKEALSVAKSFWQHTGDGISSRLAERSLNLLQTQFNEQNTKNFNKVSTRRVSFCKRYSNGQISNGLNLTYEPKETLSKDIASIDNSIFVEQNFYVEERYGRNLPISFAEKAKIELRRRIANSLKIENLSRPTESFILTEQVIKNVTEDDVFLFPTGMSSIFHAHQFLLTAFPPRKSICFGFTYVDTLKILQKFGPGCYFYGNGLSSDIDEIECLLESGEKILALFCEFPSNPLLKSPDLKRLRILADKYDFPIVVDETIGNFVNVKVFEWADITVSSLTKIFSGDSNVMGGGLILNPQRRYYEELKKVINNEYEDLLWGEDAIFLERNSRTFRERIMKINENTEEICKLLKNSPKVKNVYYPKYVTPEIYLQYKTVKGGFGGLFSITLYSDLAAQQFFDSLVIAKGPSLGTNFTLACPYTILAHYQELDWASRYGVEPGLIRVSVGLEDKNVLLKMFQQSLDAITE